MQKVALKSLTIVSKQGAIVKYEDVLHVTQNLSFLKIEYLKRNKLIEAVLPLSCIASYTSNIQEIYNPYAE